jgi:cytochrome P450
VLEEALRLYPPAWSFLRNAIAADTLGGYRIPKGAMVLLSPYTMHRHPAFWEQPETFDPERFTPERAASRPRFAYLPFGGGPRQCLGTSFALTEAQLVLATVAQRYRLRIVPGHRVEPEPLITLRLRHGLQMRLERR